MGSWSLWPEHGPTEARPRSSPNRRRHCGSVDCVLRGGNRGLLLDRRCRSARLDARRACDVDRGHGRIVRRRVGSDGSANFVVAATLKDRHQNRDDDADHKNGGDQSPVAEVLVRHVEARKSRCEQSDRNQEKENLQG